MRTWRCRYEDGLRARELTELGMEGEFVDHEERAYESFQGWGSCGVPSGVLALDGLTMSGRYGRELTRLAETFAWAAGYRHRSPLPSCP